MATEKLLPRDQVPEQLKWNLKLLFESDEAMKTALQKTLKRVEQFTKLNGKVGQSANNLLTALQSEKVIDEELEREYVYGFLRRDSDTTQAQAATLYGEVANTLSQISAQTAFLEPEIVAIDEDQLQQFIASEPQLNEFKFMLTKIRQQKAHILSDKEEQLLGRASKSLDAADDIYNTLNDADLDFGLVHDDNGNEVPLTHGNRSQFTESQNREVRKEATFAYEKPYHNLRNTFAQTLNSLLVRKICKLRLGVIAVAVKLH